MITNRGMVIIALNRFSEGLELLRELDKVVLVLNKEKGTKTFIQKYPILNELHHNLRKEMSDAEYA